MAAKGVTSSSDMENIDFLLEIETKVRNWWEDKKILISSENPGYKFFERFPFDRFMGHQFSLSKLEQPPDIPIDAMRFALAYVCDGPVDAAKIDYLHSNAVSVFDAANTAILSLTKEMSCHEEFVAGDWEPWLRTGPPSTSADKVFANDINIALNKTKQHYEAWQFREALESGFLALQDARDWYKTLCGGTTGMNFDLVVRFMKTQTLLVAPICPHYSEYVWRKILHNVTYLVKTDWPAADAPEDSTLHSIHKYLKRLIATLKTRIERERIEREKDKLTYSNIEVLLYVNEDSFTLKTGEDEEAELPFREMQVLLQNLNLIKREIGVHRMQVLSATNPHDLAKAGFRVGLIKNLPPEPGRPTSLVLKRGSLNSSSNAQLKPSAYVYPHKRSNGECDLPDQGASKHRDDFIQVLEWCDQHSEQKHRPIDYFQSYPPYKLIFKGSFDKAMDAACEEDKWLLVNLQRREDLSSHKLNRDIWADKAISQIISTNFIFWQDYFHEPIGAAVYRHYELESRTVVIIIDPITGQVLRSWNGMVQPELFLGDLVLFLDSSPRQKQVAKEEEEKVRRAMEASMECLRFETKGGSTSKKNLVMSSNTSPTNTKATEEDEEEELLTAMAASMESIKVETSSTTSSSKQDIVPLFSSSPGSTTSTEEEEERLRALEAFVERMKLETSNASTSKGDAGEEEELRRAMAASSIEDPLEMLNLKPIVSYEVDEEEPPWSWEDIFDERSASSSKVYNNVGREEDDEELQRALVASLGGWWTSSASTKEEEEDDEELQRALAASMESVGDKEEETNYLCKYE
ncbi:hypothetical protein ACLB2K_038928 [Fragaria x ananassa]